jgi:transglutaminase-like putative cysteine protease
VLASASPQLSMTPADIWSRVGQVPPHKLRPYGQYGVPGTIKLMADAAKGPRGGQNIGIIQLAREVVRGVRAKDYAAEIAALYYWVCRNYRYVRDPVHVELVQDPVAFVKNGMSADCDDVATFLAALAMAVGCPARFVTVSFTRTRLPATPAERAFSRLGGDPQIEFTHVFCEAFVSRSNNWLTIDPVAGPMTEAMRSATIWRRNYPIDPDMGRIETIRMAA